MNNANKIFNERLRLLNERFQIFARKFESDLAELRRDAESKRRLMSARVTAASNGVGMMYTLESLSDGSMCAGDRYKSYEGVEFTVQSVESFGFDYPSEISHPAIFIMTCNAKLELGDVIIPYL